jgi:TRAP-type mannitol/chloroaromatic compound transport system permease small subunit
MADSDDGGAGRTVRRHGALSFGIVTGTLNAIGTVWIFVLMALISADVIGRGAFEAPLLGVPEMVQFSIVGIVFLQLAHTLRNGALTRSDVILRGLLVNFPVVGHALQMLFHAAGALVFFIIFRTTIPLMARAFRDGDFYGATGVFQLIVWPLKLIIIVSCAAMIIQFLLLAWADLRVVIGLDRPARPAARVPSE